MSAYIIVQIETENPANLDRYRELAMPTMKAHKIRPLAKAPNPGVLEGRVQASMALVLEAPSVEAAHAWHSSAEYAAAIEARRDVATFTMFVIPAVA